MSRLRNNSFEIALDVLADNGYTPARIFKQSVLGSDSGSAHLLQALVLDEQGSLYVRFAQVSAAVRRDDVRVQAALDELLADDPAHLPARRLAALLASEQHDEWRMMQHRTALAELDPNETPASPLPQLHSDKKKPETTFSATSFSLCTSEIQLLRQTPMVTETLADLFRDQGHNRMAAAMYKRLLSENYRDSLLEKLRTVTRQSSTGVRSASDETSTT